MQKRHFLVSDERAVLILLRILCSYLLEIAQYKTIIYYKYITHQNGLDKGRGFYNDSECFHTFLRAVKSYFNFICEFVMVLQYITISHFKIKISFAYTVLAKG